MHNNRYLQDYCLYFGQLIHTQELWVGAATSKINVHYSEQVFIVLENKSSGSIPRHMQGRFGKEEGLCLTRRRQTLLSLLYCFLFVSAEIWET